MLVHGLTHSFGNEHNSLIQEKEEGAEREGYKPKALKWLKDVQKLENEWESMQESIAAAKKLAYKCCPNCCLRLEVSAQAQNMRVQLCKLIDIGESFVNRRPVSSNKECQQNPTTIRR